ncbi:coiled-coil domain-containing protein [Mycoplasmopsis glycophila]|uniref:Uncharacterized protein conserved in bacteria with the myosin-like domain n=3 Tax=Mycoplasmopsis glycophila TaxID=171285 RepID=A0A449AUZ8_9BACT|nr:hypothetical protein [Mycoplasmopsis glycophila]VEU70337.1 Uncharacterized protein conserved in bacteria with the myosin-like domain [Mycoplasmopsis glycophila]
MEKNKKKNRKKLILASILGMGVAGAIIIPPLLMKHCSQIKQIESDKKQILNLNIEITNLENAVDNLKAQLRDKEEQIASLKDQLEAERNKLIKARAKLLILVGSEDENFDFGANGENALNGSLVNELRRDIAEKEETIRLLEIDLAELRDAYSELERELEEKEQQNLMLLNKIEDLIAENNHKIAMLNMEISFLEGENDKKDQIIAEKEQEIANLNNHIVDLNNTITERENTIKENEKQISTLTKQRDIDKKALLNSLLEYRKAIKELVALTNSIKEKNTNFVDNLFTDYNDLLEEENSDLAKIISLKVNQGDYTRLLNGETLTINDNKQISLNSTYDNFDTLEAKYEIPYDKFLNLSDEHYKEFFFNDDNLIKENYDEQITLLNLLKDKANSNATVLNDSLFKMLELNKERNTELVKYINRLIDQIEKLTGERISPLKDFGSNGENATGGVIQTLKNQIANLEDRFNKAKQKLNEYVGSEDENFEAGENGENALANSLVERLRREINDKQTIISQKETEIREKDAALKQKEQEISNLQTQNQGLNQDLENKKQEISRLETTKTQNEARISELETQKANLERENVEKDQSIATLTREKQEALALAEEYKQKYERERGNSASSSTELTNYEDKLYELTGSRNWWFDVGTNGENALAGSLIYRLNQDIKDKDAEIKKLNGLIIGKETANDEYKLKYEALNVKSVGQITNTFNTDTVFFKAGHEWDTVKSQFQKFNRTNEESYKNNALAFDMYFENERHFNFQDIYEAYRKENRKQEKDTYFQYFVLNPRDLGGYLGATIGIDQWEASRSYALDNIDYSYESYPGEARRNIEDYHDEKINSIMSKSLLFKSRISFNQSWESRNSNFLCNFNNEKKTLTYSSLQSKVYDYNRTANEITKKYTIRQLIRIPKSNDDHAFTFRESVIEIQWKPKIEISRSGNDIVFEFYVVPLSMTTKSGDDNLVKFGFYLAGQNGIRNYPVYSYTESWMRATNKNIGTISSADDVSSYLGSVFLHDKIAVPNEFIDYGEAIPSSMTLQLN